MAFFMPLGIGHHRHPSICAFCCIANRGMMTLNFHLIIFLCKIVTLQQSIMTKKDKWWEESNSILPTTREATRYYRKNIGFWSFNHTPSHSTESQVTPESFVTNQWYLSLGKSLKLCGSIFLQYEAIIILPLTSLMCCKIQMRSCVWKYTVKCRALYKPPGCCDVTDSNL